jgi:hypothetical protein
MNNKNKNKNKIDKIDKYDNDSSDVSSYNENYENINYENMNHDEISQKSKNKFVNAFIGEQVVKYFKIDDSIKTKKKEIRIEIKHLEVQKKQMEKYIIDHLNSINEDYVTTPMGKLTKTTSKTKGVIKLDNIKTSVINSIKKQNINVDEKKIIVLLDDILNSVEESRAIKERTFIKRTKGKILLNKNKKENIEDNDDEEIPKFNE